MSQTPLQVKLLTVKETAAVLRVKPQWVYKMARSGALPNVRLGRQVRIDEAALQRWLAEQAGQGAKVSQ